MNLNLNTVFNGGVLKRDQGFWTIWKVYVFIKVPTTNKLLNVAFFQIMLSIYCTSFASSFSPAVENDCDAARYTAPPISDPPKTPN